MSIETISDDAAPEVGPRGTGRLEEETKKGHL